jgi:hypothetical protein
VQIGLVCATFFAANIRMDVGIIIKRKENFKIFLSFFLFSITLSLSLSTTTTTKVLLSYDRYLSVRIKSWKSSYMTSKKALLTAFAVEASFRLFHSSILFTFGMLEESVNATTNESSTRVICYGIDGYSPTIMMTIWEKVREMLYIRKKKLSKRQ